MLLLVILSPLRLDVAHKEDLIVLGAWYRVKLPSAVKQAQLLSSPQVLPASHSQQNQAHTHSGAGDSLGWCVPVAIDTLETLWRPRLALEK